MSKRPEYQPLFFVPPCQPTLVAEPPKGGGWIHEIKHDGYRTQLVIEPEQVRAFTKNGHDWTARYQPVIVAAAGLDVGTAIIDGEMIVQGKDGRSDFDALGAAIRRAPARLVFYAFDLLHLNGQDLTRLPLVERRALLREIVPVDPKSSLQFSEDVAGSGPDVFAAADAMGLEGIVSKRADSFYRSGPSRRWLKTKCWTESEFLVVGAEVDRRGLPMARLARMTDEGLTPAGAAVIALRGAEREQLHRTLDRINGRRAIAAAAPRVVVKHLKGSGPIRHASVKRLAE